MTKSCAQCHAEFAPQRKDKLYCSKRCNTAASRGRRRSHIRAWHNHYYHTNEQRRQDKLRTSRERAHRLKVETFDAYGGRVCIGCGEAEECVLSLDHISGGGNKHRQECNGKVYLDLKRRGYPPGYRVLCMNCQFRARHGAPFPNERQHMHKEYVVIKVGVTADQSE